MKTIAFLLLLALSLNVNGQSKLNQLDSTGKKHGKWIIYLDPDWKKVKDSIRGVFIRYTYYDHGTNLYPMGSCGGKNYKLEIKPNSLQKDGYQLLDGEYTWYDPKGRLSSVHVFKKGEYISCKEYYSNGTLHQHFDYTKKCEGQDHGWRVDIYNKKGELELQSWMCKDKTGKWPLIRD
jgi:hypothetical protein